MDKPTIKLTFPEPRDGWWDGGKRSGGEFTPTLLMSHGTQLVDGHPGKDHTIRWGDFSLNFWFNCGSGRSWKEARAIAIRRLVHLCHVPGTVIE